MKRRKRKKRTKLASRLNQSSSKSPDSKNSTTNSQLSFNQLAVAMGPRLSPATPMKHQQQATSKSVPLKSSSSTSKPTAWPMTTLVPLLVTWCLCLELCSCSSWSRSHEFDSASRTRQQIDRPAEARLRVEAHNWKKVEPNDVIASHHQQEQSVSSDVFGSAAQRRWRRAQKAGQVAGKFRSLVFRSVLSPPLSF